MLTHEWDEIKLKLVILNDLWWTISHTVFDPSNKNWVKSWGCAYPIGHFIQNVHPIPCDHWSTTITEASNSVSTFKVCVMAGMEIENRDIWEFNSSKNTNTVNFG